MRAANISHSLTKYAHIQRERERESNIKFQEREYLREFNYLKQVRTENLEIQ